MKIFFFLFFLHLSVITYIILISYSHQRDYAVTQGSKVDFSPVWRDWFPERVVNHHKNFVKEKMLVILYFCYSNIIAFLTWILNALRAKMRLNHQSDLTFKFYLIRQFIQINFFVLGIQSFCPKYLSLLFVDIP